MASIETEPGKQILFGAVVAGVAGECLFVDAGWGLGASLWMLGLGVQWIILKGMQESTPNYFSRLLLIPVVLLALCFGWRDALFLKIATIIGLITVLGLVMQSSQMWFRQRRMPGLFSTMLRSFREFFWYYQADFDWGFLNGYVNGARVKSMIKGTLLAIPPLFIFGVLLSMADHKFGDLMGALISIDVVQLPGQFLSIILFSILAGVFLYGSLFRIDGGSQMAISNRFSLSMLETGVVLGLINLMFGAFVFLQLGYLFGGVEYLQEAGDLTLKFYTRKGFFELVIVALLALPLLMGFKHFFKPASKAENVQFNILASIQIMLLLIMLVSASQRMWLYVSTAGITELRLYSSVFMAWLAFVLGWFGWTSLRGFPLRFVRGSALAGVVMVLCLNVLNPDAVIMKINLDRAMQGLTYNGDTLKYLQSDAIPVAMEAFPDLRPKEQQLILEGLKNYREEHNLEGWRDWNYAKQVASKFFEECGANPLLAAPPEKSAISGQGVGSVVTSCNM